MRMLRSAALLATFLLAVPGVAAADLFLTPYAGVNFGGKTVDPRVNAGVTLTWMGAGIFGAEADVGFVPDFFSPRDAEVDLLGSNNVTTVMANLVVGRSRGTWRPYVSAGGGVLRTQVGSFGGLLDATTHGFGIDAGAGVRVGEGRVGLRGDVRYFRQLSDVDRLLEDAVSDFAFWRSSVGLSIGF